MRIVAGDALEARISLTPAAVSFEAIRLKTPVAYARCPSPEHLPKCDDARREQKNSNPERSHRKLKTSPPK
jgi:hypothetical protein